VPARTSSTPRRARPPSPSADKLLEQRAPLVRAQPAQASALGDLELRHEVTRPDLADAGQRLEHTHDLQFREHVARLVAALGRIEQLAQGERADLEFVLHLRTLAAGNRRLLQRELTLLRCERGRVRHVVPPARRRDAILIRDATSRPESAATQHSETASVCNWSGVCTAGVLALVI